MALASSMERMPSAAGAMSGEPWRMALVKFWRTSLWLALPVGTGRSTDHDSGLAKPAEEAALNSDMGVRLREKRRERPSRERMPRSPEIWRRLRPGASPVLVMKVAWVPFV